MRIPLLFALAVLACGTPDSENVSLQNAPVTCGAISGSADLVNLYGLTLLEWADHGVAIGGCVEHIEWLPDADMGLACDSDEDYIDGCVMGTSVYVREGLQVRRERARETVMHEECHTQRRDSAHLDECGAFPGNSIMCPSGGPDGQPVTDRDAEFCAGAARAAVAN